MDLSSTYLGFKLKNPIIVASSSLTGDLQGVKRMADAGAGAVVLKSLFEEQIHKEYVQDMEQHITGSWHYEARDYVKKMGMELGPREYLQLIEDAKKSVDIPVIASLNCVSSPWWKDYARQIELAGADALELNISYFPFDVKKTAREVESLYYQILEKVHQTVELPIAVKVGPYFTSFANVAYELCSRGAAALVLFNRFYQFDIDPEKMKMTGGNPLSTAQEMSLTLRWIGLLTERVNCDLAATTGIHDAAGVIKQILAGAHAVQICSVLYQKKTSYISEIADGVSSWMKKKGFESLDQARGTLSYQKQEKPELYQRLQYIKALVGIE
ncbi:MAG: dihydroorotate dehydrogenase-like protein [Spirochaetota bacterium]